MDLSYLSGFGNEHETEALPNALPKGQFNPQRCEYGLYAEQFSTTAFTAPRDSNRRSWTYRIRPSVVKGDYQPIAIAGLCEHRGDVPCPPDAMRWFPFPIPRGEPIDFIQGLSRVAENGDARSQSGMGIYVYTANTSMQHTAFYNADGEWLIVPQKGQLLVKTEFGRLQVSPKEIAVIPRGVKFAVELLTDTARGYICENYGEPLRLPERGPVGANGFANERDFQYPVAWFEDVETDYTLLCKFDGQCYQSALTHSPFDVVAWVGNSAPYKYDLTRFNVINTVSFDHPDPSIFTVLTSPSATPGTANVDFVIFPPRWMVAENTFRPPWYHRNLMSEFMGLIEGVYDAKEHGFEPGGMSLHNCMTPHGPEAEVFEKASQADLSPQYYADTLAFMFESRYVIRPTALALAHPYRQNYYTACWQTIEKHFSAN